MSWHNGLPLLVRLSVRCTRARLERDPQLDRETPTISRQVLDRSRRDAAPEQEPEQEQEQEQEQGERRE